ncbi:MAG: hypothetical protein HYT37_00550 [Candidatus Sungbacteria bacterium]|nr:hypothetical protein [Candidatus Sungbacteria bacterium]
MKKLSEFQGNVCGQFIFINDGTVTLGVIEGFVRSGAQAVYPVQLEIRMSTTDKPLVKYIEDIKDALILTPWEVVAFINRAVLKAAEATTKLKAVMGIIERIADGSL